MRTLLRLFFHARGINAWAVLSCLLIASIVESVGIVSLVPLLTVATGVDQTGKSSQVMVITRDVMTTLGLPMEVGSLLVFFVSAMILKSLISFFAMFYVGNAVTTFTARLRSELINNLFRIQWSYLVHHPVGRFTNALSGQITRASSAIELVASFLAGIIQSVAYLGVAFFISWPLAIASISIGLFLVGSLNFLIRIARKSGLRRTQRTREMVIFMTDTLINVKPIRAMSQQTAFSQLLERKISSLRKATRTGVLSAEGLKSSQEILITIILAIGFFLVITYWQMPIIELGIVGVMLKKLTNGITKTQRLFQQASVVESPYIEVRDLLAETASLPETNPGKNKASFTRNIQLENVSFSHDDKPVLHSLSMEIPAGQITVLTGHSGSGKTTIADIILGLYQPDQGRVLIDGMPLQNIDLYSWRKLIGYVPQDPVLFHDTLYGNISMGDPKINKTVTRTALELAGAWDFIKELPDGMMTVTGQHGAKLSGGQRQRIAIARALVHEPLLLILDEVTSALDPKTEQEICQNILSLSKKTTILGITHRPALLEIADRVYRIEDGNAHEAPPLRPAEVTTQT